MYFSIKYELVNENVPKETKNLDETIELVKAFPWEDKFLIGDKEISYPSIDIINPEEKIMLSITALENKEKLLFVVENIFVGKLARGTTGVLIKNVPLKQVVEIVKLFCTQDYAAIKKLDNSGLISKLLRKIIFLFASDEED